MDDDTMVGEDKKIYLSPDKFKVIESYGGNLATQLNKVVIAFFDENFADYENISPNLPLNVITEAFCQLLDHYTHLVDVKDYSSFLHFLVEKLIELRNIPKATNENSEST